MDDVKQISGQIAIFERQAEILKRNIEMMQIHLQEILVARETIDGLKSAADDQEVLFPIGAGCYLFGKLTKNDEVIVNLGSNISAKEERKKGIASLDKRTEDIKKLISQTSTSFLEISKKIEELDQKGRDILKTQNTSQSAAKDISSKSV
ncbi:MAG: prefoldin subunit alpha [Candidatus Methanofastidiosia archaeon]